MNFFDKFKIAAGDQNIQFLCDPDIYDSIPKPYPARKFIPDWYKKLSPRNKPEGKSGPGQSDKATIKRCPPFLDAMVTGWIIPLVADIQIETNEDASYIEWYSQTDLSLIETHRMDQVTGNPWGNCPPLKFINHWLVKVPPGWSVLFTPPLNRPNPHIDLLSGIVECDKYYEIVNFPGFFTTPNWVGQLEIGMPLMQVIPFKREILDIKSEIRPFTEHEIDKLNKQRFEHGLQTSVYRDTMWERK